MSVSLDRLDRRILFELDCNSRRSLSSLARQVRLGRDLVSYRIARLKEQGVLDNCTAMINPYKLDLTVYRTYLKLEADKERWAQFVRHLDLHPRTSWLTECYGRWDVVWNVLAATPKEVYDLQDVLFSKFSDIIVGYNVCTLVNYWRFPKKYLIGTSVDDIRGWQFELPEFTTGTTPLEHELDDIERGLIRLLSADATLSFVDLAEALKVTPAIAKYRTEKLEELGIIAGYRVNLNREALGQTLFTVQASPRDFVAENEAEFHKFCRVHPQITAYTQQLGDCKIEFEVEARDYAEFSKVIDEIRERFSRYLRSLDYLMVKKDYFHRTPSHIVPVGAAELKAPADFYEPEPLIHAAVA